ncbi:jmjC domain-containing protein 4 isoform X2 [Asparagus officinalis]|nr:jmjC domain-containing protein 4 isoform X2 [Asparagus officinalis]XP_020264847.1 jmjC domain-containing protein 4 isoform X2 [Asparagus officinalis]
MSVSEFVDHWLEFSAGNCGDDVKCNKRSQSLWYLKDWHFVKEYPKYVAYTTPSFFLDDWLNLYLDTHSMHQHKDTHHDKNDINCADYRFVYMGAKGTWTPLHADVFRSYSWSANVCGKKLWLLLPPLQCHLIFDRNLKTSIYDVHGDISEIKFPGFSQAIWWECTQEQNEIIFVPSGWYHQVHNLEDTISINHNWFNAYNLSWVWNLLLKDYKEAKEYIEDIREICDDFESLCQRNLAANTGMNYYDLFIFIRRFALANLTLLHDLRKDENTFLCLSKAHILISNLVSIREVALRMVSAEAFAEENLNRYSEGNLTALSDIKKITDEPCFIELCTAISRTLETIGGVQAQYHKERNQPIFSSEGKFEVFNDCGCIPCTPEDLVKMIDLFISDLSIHGKDFKFGLQSNICGSETFSIERVVL